jgi:hypothetical protein
LHQNQEQKAHATGRVTITSEHRFPSAQRLIGLHIRTHAQAKVDQRNQALTRA